MVESVKLIANIRLTVQEVPRIVMLQNIHHCIYKS